MATLRVYALGQPRVCRDHDPLHFPTRKAQALLCLLLLRAGETLDRDVIAEQLWPMRPPGQARRNLCTALWRLRQTLECRGFSARDYLLSRRHVLAFDAVAPYWFDVQAFKRQARFGLSGGLPCDTARRTALEEALSLYQGALLEGCYDEWCLEERERMRVVLLQVLKRLQRDYRLCGSFEAAISCGQRLLALDPLQEDVHRELMRCYAESGQRPLALVQFRHCWETLQRELHIEPMAATQHLHRRLQGSEEPLSLQGERGDDGASLGAVVTELQQALHALESARYAVQTVAAEFGEESGPC